MPFLPILPLVSPSWRPSFHLFAPFSVYVYRLPSSSRTSTQSICASFIASLLETSECFLHVHPIRRIYMFKWTVTLADSFSLDSRSGRRYLHQGDVQYGYRNFNSAERGTWSCSTDSSTRRGGPRPTSYAVLPKCASVYPCQAVLGGWSWLDVDPKRSNDHVHNHQQFSPEYRNFDTLSYFSTTSNALIKK